MLDFSAFNSLHALVRYFTSNEICKDFLAAQRWGNDVVCPYCGSHNCHKCKDGRFVCSNRSCSKKFSVTVGTIFEASNLPLTKWFEGIYLISAHKKGISSHQLSRDLGVTQKTAWNMLHKVRSCFSQNDEIGLSGQVEIDEAYIGGNNKWRHEWKKQEGGQGGANKTSIVGLLERTDGRVVAVKTDDTTRKTLFPLISQFVEGSGTIVYTDESRIYDALQKDLGIAHLTCNHSAKLFSDGNGTHTNGIEGFWSHFKRMVYGTYHWVSEDYIQRYIDEHCFRWNTRKMKEGERFEIFFNACIGKFTYNDVRSLSSKKVA